MTGRLALTNLSPQSRKKARNEKIRGIRRQIESADDDLSHRKNECLEMNLEKKQNGNSDRKQGT